MILGTKCRHLLRAFPLFDASGRVYQTYLDGGSGCDLEDAAEEEDSNVLALLAFSAPPWCVFSLENLHV